MTDNFPHPKITARRRQLGRDALKNSDDDGTLPPMEPDDIHGRVSKLEGGFATQQWAVGVVSASFLAAAGISIAVTLALRSEVSSLSEKVDALPSEIRQELQGLNSSMIEAIKAGQAPAVVVIPQSSPGELPATPPAPKPGSPSE